MDYDKLLKKAINEYDITGVLHLGACAPCNQLKIYEENNIEQIILVEGNPELIKMFPDFHPSVPSGCELISAVVSDTDDEVVNFRVIYSKDGMNKGCSSIYKLSSSAYISNIMFEKDVLELKTVTVDTLLRRNGINPSSINLLAMDIQGAELAALQGAKNLLPYLDAISTEVSWTKLYEDQATIDQIDSFLSEHGFSRVETMKCHATWGEALYTRDKRE